MLPFDHSPRGLSQHSFVGVLRPGLIATAKGYANILVSGQGTVATTLLDGSHQFSATGPVSSHPETKKKINNARVCIEWPDR